jgi:hypothetical protein
MVALAAMLALTGCMSGYNIRLTNGSVIGAKNKPKLDKENEVYVFKDATGKKVSIPSLRVVEISPRGAGSDDGGMSNFKAKPMRR